MPFAGATPSSACAKARARELRLAGAAFPWRTIRGEECSGYWPAGTAAFHVNAVRRRRGSPLRRRDGATPTSSAGQGFDLLVETARLWRSLGHHDAEGRFRIDGVTGPDEYTALVNNNIVHQPDGGPQPPGRRRRQRHATRSARPSSTSDDDEIASWRARSRRDRRSLRRRARVTSQSEGFTRYRAWDFAAHATGAVPAAAALPVLPALFEPGREAGRPRLCALRLRRLVSTAEQKRRDFDYYEAITVRDSSLSALDPGDRRSGGRATSNSPTTTSANRRSSTCTTSAGNTADGLHLASLAGAWLVAVAGFGGLRDHGETLAFAPRLPRGPDPAVLPARVPRPSHPRRDRLRWRPLRATRRRAARARPPRRADHRPAWRAAALQLPAGARVVARFAASRARAALGPALASTSTDLRRLNFPAAASRLQSSGAFCRSARGRG